MKSTKSLVVLAEELEDVVVVEDGGEGAVLAREAEAEETVPLDKVDGRRGVVRDDAHDGRLDLGRGAEVVLADLHDVRGGGEQLAVGREAAVERVAGLRDEAQRKLALEHQHGLAERGPLREQLEHERRRHLVRRVRDAHVKVREVDLQTVRHDHLQLPRVLRRGHALLQRRRHARVNLDHNHLLRDRQQLHRQVPGAGTNLQHHVRAPQIRLVHNPLRNQRVLQQMLALAVVQLKLMMTCL